MNKIIHAGKNVLAQIKATVYKKPLFFSGNTAFGLHVSIKEQVIFLKRLSMMLRAQMPIVTSLQMMAVENSSSSLKIITSNLASDMLQGQSLGTAILKYKKIFSFFCISIITVGERSGTLPENLEYIAIELKKKNELRTQIMSALIYPVIVIIATVAITAFLIVYIFPKIIPIFLSVKTTLPLSTRLLISVSEFLTVYGWYLLGVITVGIFSAPLLFRNQKILYYGTLLLLRMPVIGKICRCYNLAQISRTLGLLLASDVSITNALEITRSSTQNIVYKQALQIVGDAILIGKNISEPLQNQPSLFPILMVQMIKVGERTGNMSPILVYVSEMYETDIRDLTKNLTTIIEPLLMLFMGITVGFIAISIITPIYGITQNLHQ